MIESSAKADDIDAAEKNGGDTPVSTLIVDDDEVVCKLLETVLIGAGHDVYTCLSGQQAIAKLKERSFDLVITDLKMPGIDGFDVLRKAKASDPLCEVIVITAYGSVESAVEAMKLGAHDHITKPFNLDHIILVADKALEKRALVRVAQERDFYERLSRTDGLTEIYNYRAFHDLLGLEIGRSKRYLHPLSLLMIDVDNLNVYNDTLGHLAGDAILSQVAGLLENSVRKCDIVARYGGDEFAIILVETHKSNALDTANRLVGLVEETAFEHEHVLPNNTLTISIGVASYPNDAVEKRELVTKADRALYEAKALGGNRVRVAWA